MGYGAKCLGLTGPGQNNHNNNNGVGDRQAEGCCSLRGCLKKMGGCIFIATAVTNFIAGGVSLSTPALGRHLQSSFNGTTAVHAGEFYF